MCDDEETRDDDLKSDALICGCNIVQKLVGVLADEGLLVVTSCVCGDIKKISFMVNAT